MPDEKVNNNGNDDSPQIQAQQDSDDAGRGRVTTGPDRAKVIPSDASDATAGDTREPEFSSVSRDSDIPSIASIQQTLAFIQENHLHSPLLVPDAQTLKALSEAAPELYQLYVKAIDAEIETSKTERLKRFTVPESYARRGQILGFLMCLAVLGLAGFAIYRDMTVLAGTLAGIDVIGLAAVFGANQKPKER